MRYFMDALRLELGLSLDQVCELFDISKRTWRRWIANQHFPKHVKRVLELLAGDLSQIHGDWHGCTIRKDKLFIRGWDKPILIGEIRAIPINRERMYVQKQTIDQLRKEIATLKQDAPSVLEVLVKNKHTDDVLTTMQAPPNCYFEFAPNDESCDVTVCEPLRRAHS